MPEQRISFLTDITSTSDAAIYCPDSVSKSMNVSGPIIHVSALVDRQTLSVNNMESKNNLAVFPNPFKDRITLNSDDIINAYTICNIAGQVISKNEAVNSKTIQVQILNNEPGAYFMSIKTENQNKTFKLIKQ